jgi:hypothetical protein
MKTINTKTTKRMKGVLAMALAVSLAATGCSAQWISVALADLPVLVQMALNIATFAETAQGKVISAADEAAVQSISNEASKDLNLLQSLYNEYKASPSDAGLQKINAAIGVIQQNLPALLQAAHISDAALSQQVTAGMNLILTTVESFAALMPQGAQSSSLASANVHAQLARPRTVPTAAELKKAWNETVCSEVRCAIK